MIKYFGLILFIIFVISCNHGKERDKIYSHDTIQLSFFPSFDPFSEFLFKMDSSKPSVKLKIFYPSDKYSEFEGLIYDTTKIELNPVFSKSFFSGIENSNLEKHRSDESFGMDGIHVEITKINVYGDTATIKFWSPKRVKNKIEYEILDKFFDLLEKEFKDTFRIEYLETIKDYFDYGLPIKLTKNKPKTYRFWGSLSINNEQKLKEFISNLPYNEPIIFDFTNFPGMGNMYHSLFKNLNEEKDIYYHINPKRKNTDLNEIGNCSFIDSEKKLKKINKDASQ